MGEVIQQTRLKGVREVRRRFLGLGGDNVPLARPLNREGGLAARGEGRRVGRLGPAEERHDGPTKRAGFCWRRELRVVEIV